MVILFPPTDAHNPSSIYVFHIYLFVYLFLSQFELGLQFEVDASKTIMDKLCPT